MREGIGASQRRLLVEEVEEAGSCSWNLLVRLGASLKRKHSSARGHKQAYSTFQKPAGCDFSTPSHGLGYSACLCELMLLPQCFSAGVFRPCGTTT